MKKLRIEVSGYWQEVFQGSEIESFRFLQDLKERQMTLLSEERLKSYKTLHTSKVQQAIHIGKYKETERQRVFRDYASQFALKIKILHL